MRFSTDDGQFGLIVSPRPGDGRLFTFRLVVGGCLVGDDEPFILGSIMGELQSRPSFGAGELPDAQAAPVDVVKLLLDDELRLRDHRIEAAMLHGAESLGCCLAWLYVQGAYGVAVAQATGDNERVGPVLVSRVGLTGVRGILGAAVRHWRELSPPMRPPTCGPSGASQVAAAPAQAPPG